MLSSFNLYAIIDIYQFIFINFILKLVCYQKYFIEVQWTVFAAFKSMKNN